MGVSGYDVIIVGYGPVGAVAANLLGQAGLAVAVVERTASVYHLPRASHFDDDVMRVFQAAGLAAEIEAITATIEGTDVIGPDGNVILSVTDRDLPGVQGWTRGYAFWQPDLEAELRRGVRRFENVDELLEHEVEAVIQHDGAPVSVQVRDLGSGAVSHLTASWVLGCDGARSLCRAQAGIDLDDLGFHELWLVVDALRVRPVELPRVVQQICSPERPRMFFPSAGNHCRWEFKIRDGESPTDVAKPDHIARLLASWVDPDDIEVTRTVVYAFKSLIARQWRDGNLLLLGDAAHQMPRFLGQGMCAGIRDVANVAWKLALVAAGTAPPSLLDTYQIEREPHVRTVTKLSVDFGRFLEAATSAQQRTPRVTDLAFPGLVAGVVHHGPAAGSVFPQPRVHTAHGATVPLDEVLGKSFSLVSHRDPREALSPASVAFWESLDASFVQVLPAGEPIGGNDCVALEGAAPDLTGLLADDEVVVVRPDRYVYGTTRDWVTGDGLTAAMRGDLGQVGVA
ncbi:MAG: bifunctional 3-(3-hydroxy-phenyl)propionate/3-hydroxycinnamic acid hydroxylase [Acidimicrobiia bacterium]|nr:bifunctional 3-(3-hydroxy-phenyl)propionate/3-hydroxycinnamic acid hydroxylase [Acidimicrobiia bacterium]